MQNKKGKTENNEVITVSKEHLKIAVGDFEKANEAQRPLRIKVFALDERVRFGMDVYKSVIQVKSPHTG